MKIHKIEIMIIDFDNLGAEDIIDTLHNTHYPNRCISPTVKKIETRDIGEWSDDHPLNHYDTVDAEYKRIFSQ